MLNGINKTASKTLSALIQKASEQDGHVKIENKSFMPLCVEILKDISTKYSAVSICHYGEQNGDLMRDPEMMFLIFPGVCNGPDIYVPYYIRNDYMGTERWALRPAGSTDGKEKFLVNKREQKDQAVFANMWLRNIKNQGFI